MIDFSDSIKIEDRYGTWYEIDRAKASDGREYILFESEQYGDETAAILCILPKDNEVKRMVGKKTGKEYIVIPHEFEVEETYDTIDDAIEQDLGLDVVNEDLEEACHEELKETLEVGEDERDTILNFFNKQKLLWNNYPDVVDEHYGAGAHAYIVEMDNSNATYLADTEESLIDLCQKIHPNFCFDVESNDNGGYGRTYIFYYCDDDAEVYEELNADSEQRVELEVTDTEDNDFDSGVAIVIAPKGNTDGEKEVFAIFKGPTEDDIYVDVSVDSYGDEYDWDVDGWSWGETGGTEIGVDGFELDHLQADEYIEGEGEHGNWNTRDITEEEAIAILGTTKEDFDKAMKEARELAANAFDYLADYYAYHDYEFDDSDYRDRRDSYESDAADAERDRQWFFSTMRD